MSNALPPVSTVIPAYGHARYLYLTLLKHTLTYYLWGETLASIEALPRTSPLRKSIYWVLKMVDGLISRGTAGHICLARRFKFDPVNRIEGTDWPPLADTMIGLKRLDNIQFCIEEILRRNIPGDLIETGVWRGGATIFMRGVLKAHGVTDRIVWAADSFQGLPPPDATRYPSDAGDPHHTFNYFLGISLEQVKRNFERYGLLDEQVRFLKGWFKDTLPGAPIKTLALLRLDGDMYESTMDALANLYPKLSIGGYIIVDDYYLDGCKQAVHDYRRKHGITEGIQKIGEISAYWERVRPAV
jgi:O-methyltransferase